MQTNFLNPNLEIFETIPHHAWFIPDIARDIVYFNQHWKDYTGLQQRGISMQQDLEWLHPEDIERFQTQLRHATITKKPLDLDVRLKSLHGQWRWFRILAKPIVQQGVVCSWIGTNTDIHERRAIFLESQRVQQQLILMQDVALQLAAMLTLRDVCQDISVAIPKIFGCQMMQLSRLIGPDHFEVIAVHKSTLPIGQFWKLEPDSPSNLVLQTKQPVVIDNSMDLTSFQKSWFQNNQIEHAIYLPLITRFGVFGELQLGFYHYQPERATQDRVLLVTLTEIIAQTISRIQLFTELQNLNQSLEQQVAKRTEELRTHALELEAFVHSASHDLRAPLSVMLSASRQIRNNQTDSQQLVRIADSVQNAATRMNEMLNGMLDLVRGENAEAVGTVDLFEIVQQVIANFESEIQIRGIQLHVNMTHLRIAFSQTELYQVLQNIVQNAMKFAGNDQKPAWISISAMQNEAGIWLEIKNNALPIASEQLARLFELFFTTNSTQGMGLGLTIVKRILERYGARVWLESDDEFRVFIWFPLTKSEVEALTDA